MLSLSLVLTLTNIIFGFIEGLISLRVVLKLFGASASAPFVNWIYETSQPLLYPFLGMFPSPRINGSFVVEISALVGMIVYAFVGYVITEIMRLIAFRAEEFSERINRKK